MARSKKAVVDDDHKETEKEHDDDFEIIRFPTKEEKKKAYEDAREFSPVGTFPSDFEEWVEVKKTILGKREMDGVFATRDLPPGMIMGEYVGEKTDTTKRKFFGDNEASYVLELKTSKGFRYIDGEDKAKSSWLRYINRPGKGDSPNAYFFSYYNRAYVATSKPIRKGDQLFINYLLNKEKRLPSHLTTSKRAWKRTPTARERK